MYVCMYVCIQHLFIKHFRLADVCLTMTVWHATKFNLNFNIKNVQITIATETEKQKQKRKSKAKTTKVKIKTKLQRSQHMFCHSSQWSANIPMNYMDNEYNS